MGRLQFPRALLLVTLICAIAAVRVRGVYSADKDTTRTTNRSQTESSNSKTIGEKTVKVPIYTIAFSPDDRLIATGGGDGRVRIWENPSLKLVREFNIRTKEFSILADEKFGYYAATPMQLQFTPDSQSLGLMTHSVSSGEGGFSILPLLANGTVKKLFVHSYGGRRFAFVSQGKEFVVSLPWSLTGAKKNQLFLYDTKTRTLQHTFQLSDEGIASLAVNADGSRIAAASHYATKPAEEGGVLISVCVSLINVAEKKVMAHRWIHFRTFSFIGFRSRRWDSHTSCKLFFNSTGTRLYIVANNGQFWIWDARTLEGTGNEVIGQNEFSFAAALGKDETVYFFGIQRCTRWNAKINGGKPKNLSVRIYASCAATSSKGTLIAVGDGHGGLQLFESKPFRLIDSKKKAHMLLLSETRKPRKP